MRETSALARCLSPLVKAKGELFIHASPSAVFVRHASLTELSQVLFDSLQKGEVVGSEQFLALQHKAPCLNVYLVIIMPQGPHLYSSLNHQATGERHEQNAGKGRKSVEAVRYSKRFLTGVKALSL